MQIDALKAVASHIIFQNGHMATGHSLYLDGRLAFIITPHTNLTSNLPNLTDGRYFFHPNYDLALVVGCPSSGQRALNITQLSATRLGDKVVAYGFGIDANFWRGTVAKLNDGIECSETYVPWSGNTTKCPDEIVVHGSDQHPGQSGAPCLTHCGYTGVAHATHDSPYNSKYALIVPATAVRAFMLKHLDNLTRIEECERLGIINPPVDKNADCLPLPTSVPDTIQKSCSTSECSATTAAEVRLTASPPSKKTNRWSIWKW